MRKTMLWSIDCDAEEREALRAGAERAGLPLVFASWGEWTGRAARRLRERAPRHARG